MSKQRRKSKSNGVFILWPWKQNEFFQVQFQTLFEETVQVGALNIWRVNARQTWWCWDRGSVAAISSLRFCFSLCRRKFLVTLGVLCCCSSVCVTDDNSTSCEMGVKGQGLLTCRWWQGLMGSRSCCHSSSYHSTDYSPPGEKGRRRRNKVRGLKGRETFVKFKKWHKQDFWLACWSTTSALTLLEERSAGWFWEKFLTRR